MAKFDSLPDPDAPVTDEDSDEHARNSMIFHVYLMLQHMAQEDVEFALKIIMKRFNSTKPEHQKFAKLVAKMPDPKTGEIRIFSMWLLIIKVITYNLKDKWADTETRGYSFEISEEMYDAFVTAACSASVRISEPEVKQLSRMASVLRGLATKIKSWNGSEVDEEDTKHAIVGLHDHLCEVLAIGSDITWIGRCIDGWQVNDMYNNTVLSEFRRRKLTELELVYLEKVMKERGYKPKPPNLDLDHRYWHAPLNEDDSETFERYKPKPPPPPSPPDQRLKDEFFCYSDKDPLMIKYQKADWEEQQLLQEQKDLNNSSNFRWICSNIEQKASELDEQQHQDLSNNNNNNNNTCSYKNNFVIEPSELNEEGISLFVFLFQFNFKSRIKTNYRRCLGRKETN